VASVSGDSETEGQETHEPRECMACRGSGRVISNLGGTPSEVPCPWCEGTGVRVPGIDAQAHWPANPSEPPAAQPPPPTDADAGSAAGATAGQAHSADRPPADGD
jgi:hypothetical protein